MQETERRIPNGYFQGLELNKNPYYKNINTSSARNQPLEKKEAQNSIYSFFMDKFNYLKNFFYNKPI